MKKKIITESVVLKNKCFISKILNLASRISEINTDFILVDGSKYSYMSNVCHLLSIRPKVIKVPSVKSNNYQISFLFKMGITPLGIFRYCSSVTRGKFSMIVPTLSNISYFNKKQIKKMDSKEASIAYRLMYRSELHDKIIDLWESIRTQITSFLEINEIIQKLSLFNILRKSVNENEYFPQLAQMYLEQDGLNDFPDIKSAFRTVYFNGLVGVPVHILKKLALGSLNSKKKNNSDISA